MASCSDILADGEFLVATCGDGHGGTITSRMDLNLCIVNDHGKLVPQNKYAVPMMNPRYNLLIFEIT